MRLGATLASLSPGPAVPIAERVRILAGAGFESLWIPQILGRGYLVTDPFVALAVAATVTEGVEIGTATLQIPLHHPVELAHRIRSLQSVCGDRLVLGVSPGSTETDFLALDRDFGSRFQTLHENVARLRTLLRDGRDDQVDIAPPGTVPPLLLGSWGANVERAAREFDGWLASAYRRTPEQILAAHERFRAAGGGRAIVCAIQLTESTDLGPTRELLHRYADAGFDDAVVVLEPGGPNPDQVRALVP